MLVYLRTNAVFSVLTLCIIVQKSLTKRNPEEKTTIQKLTSNISCSVISCAVDS